MSELPHKQYQQLYQMLVQDHPDDFAKMEIVLDEELLNNAKHYFLEASFPLIYPAKSMAVAVIYALLLEETYAINPLESLRDLDLFLGQDEYFQTYDNHPAVYDELLEWVLSFPNWKEMGWAPKTVEYFRLECTEAGIQEVMDKQQCELLNRGGRPSDTLI
ncbi:hypothetical protein D3C71_506550 [compost metagenome]